MCVRTAHIFHITHKKGKEVAKCGFILSTLWLGWSGRGSCFSGGGETSCNFGLAGLGPAFLSPVRTRTWGLLPSTLPCSVGRGGPPTQAEPKSELGPHSSPPFLSAGPVEAKQVLPGHNSSVSCKKKKKPVLDNSWVLEMPSFPSSSPR